MSCDRDEARLPSAPDVTTVLDRLIEERSPQHRITFDNGTEFTANHFAARAYHRGVSTDFIAPGRPVQTCYFEGLNGKLRVECQLVFGPRTCATALGFLGRWVQRSRQVTGNWATAGVP